MMLRVVNSASQEVVPPPDEELVVPELSEREEKLIHRLRKEANATNDTYTKYVFQTLSIAGVALGAVIEFMFFLPFGSYNAGNVPVAASSAVAAGSLKGASVAATVAAPAATASSLKATAVAVSAAASYAAQFHLEQPLVGLAAVPILAFALAICRIGTYYYTDSNRQFGFELFLSRIRLAPSLLRGRWQNSYKNIEWEEAMRAWRVVQSTLMRRIHPREFIFSRHKYSKEFQPDPRNNPMWFCQSSLFGADSPAEWKAGKYLDTMQLLLLFVAFIGVVILWIVPLLTQVPSQTKDPSISPPYSLSYVALVSQTPPPSRAGADKLIFFVADKAEWTAHPIEYSTLIFLAVAFLICLAIWFDYRRERSAGRILGGLAATFFFVAMAVAYSLWSGVLHIDKVVNHQPWSSNPAGFLLAYTTLLFAFLSTLALWFSARNERARRQILKDGLWSLHSCSIIWEAVIVAHYSAIRRSRKSGVSSRALAKLSRRKCCRPFGPVPAAKWKAWKRGEIRFEEILKILRKSGNKDAMADTGVDGAGLSGYTFWLGQEAASLARWADDVPAWIGYTEETLIEKHGSRDLKPHRKWYLAAN